MEQKKQEREKVRAITAAEGRLVKALASQCPRRIAEAEEGVRMASLMAGNAMETQ